MPARHVSETRSSKLRGKLGSWEAGEGIEARRGKGRRAEAAAQEAVGLGVGAAPVQPPREAQLGAQHALLVPPREVLLHARATEVREPVPMARARARR